ncbi:FtsP/CotA-like multicopper oxidase with cupredoxin domain [Azospirillum fermentarium]|uniref:multicopper oxidase domain-containing protein n=1 Tax=Azospirillum fermentarium TaxID=1233114 RepID=UPI002226C067|nr:multicopper oxidase domain-containing protein [Azospirillum fermentarium]MCW2245201.1 FtsP/CotA-like multicopper oxidase with cupredoxin domain [Azospirillum fermentarium]
MTMPIPRPVSRRGFLGLGALLAGAAAPAMAQTMPHHASHHSQTHGSPLSERPAGVHGGVLPAGTVNHARNGFDPYAMLTDWDTGTLTRDAQGRTVRAFTIVAEEKDIEIAPGILYPAWTYNGRVPGPALRVVEGERVRVTFINHTSMPHTMHFHGIHAARVDGLTGAGEPEPGERFVYEFDAFPFGCHLYHCHTAPLSPHIQRGLYGMFVIDPDPARHGELADAARSRLLGTAENARWQELMMVMASFDLNGDEKNEVYSVNTVANIYADRPILLDRTRPVRIYLLNMTEFDPINSFHVHANFFDYYDHGTTLTPTLRTVDTVMQCQGQRGLLEIDFSRQEPGSFMFHAHQAEFSDKGWMGHFEVA